MYSPFYSSYFDQQQKHQGHFASPLSTAPSSPESLGGGGAGLGERRKDSRHVSLMLPPNMTPETLQMDGPFSSARFPSRSLPSSRRNSNHLDQEFDRLHLEEGEIEKQLAFLEEDDHHDHQFSMYLNSAGPDGGCRRDSCPDLVAATAATASTPRTPEWPPVDPLAGLGGFSPSDLASFALTHQQPQHPQPHPSQNQPTQPQHPPLQQREQLLNETLVARLAAMNPVALYQHYAMAGKLQAMNALLTANVASAPTAVPASPLAPSLSRASSLSQREEKELSKKERKERRRNNHNKEHGKQPSDAEMAARFVGVQLQDIQSEIYSLCRDQHGCRFLQRKLEERVADHVEMIFGEVKEHFVELMTDPFGNYLCQKLIEYCTEEQRTALIQTVSSDLVPISLNMHGTRAVQRLIEHVSHPLQVQYLIAGLRNHVVPLIKDLNGNHVIQKCLRMSALDNQFIYDAVAQECVEVATHRHGCCVFQRCIDRATDAQRVQLAQQVIRHAPELVVDPYGNYVVQYVLDLGDARFTDRLIRQFFGSMCRLSMQKFSSNVMEKCIRLAPAGTRKVLIDELGGSKPRLEGLLKDSYGNYVVQTALDCASPSQRARLGELIRPLLPAIKNTPYGKRIQGKIQQDSPDRIRIDRLHALAAAGSGVGLAGMGGLGAGLGGVGGGLVGNGAAGYNPALATMMAMQMAQYGMVEGYPYL
ncbi:uncharacterized protein VTP21DRAFT_5396 [Calcarisporiella thermophila]|uniref:uncharacterized protein n=1 Tax=Calcarisporiella thermophila TaxID=911321 RepID=UPI003742236D